MKAQPATPQGRRDALLICLLLDHGLRAGEAALLRREDVDLAEGMLHFYRPKVGKVQMHRLSGDTRRALQACAQADELPLSGALLRRSLRGGKLATLWTVAFAIGVSTVLFQTVTRNRILTPQIMGFDALYILMQTAMVAGLGLTGFAPRP